jgi:predicted RNA-binding protein with PIN domain
MPKTVVLVDGRNVQRSRWPNVGSEELVERVHAWAEEHGLEAEVVFDGRAPEGAFGTAGASADDWIASRAQELEADGTPYWLVTSDRELRSRAGGAAERTIGGGGFLTELGLR